MDSEKIDWLTPQRTGGHFARRVLSTMTVIQSYGLTSTVYFLSYLYAALSYNRSLVERCQNLVRTLYDK